MSPAPFDKSVRLQGRNILLRAATPDDADFVLALRSDAAKTRFLQPVQADLQAQRDWLAKSHADPRQLYCVICTPDGERLGLVRLYDPQGDSICWGSWLIKDGAPASTAIESALLVYLHALALGYRRSHFDVRIGNDSVIRFHTGFGAVEQRRSEQDIYFSIGEDAIRAALHKYRRYLPAGAMP
ncbi:GNAT family N-acetyltransferase [Pseudorhodoferax sp.]|uniref:GNAT family N-acetyltransferase n=1 Tax=Pseudorhodoferax sp. TaxID=1993553 RepID=UPI002DD68128|nr:GNAT family N-acetyltransferase [Pseudorhodoferax sp.]